MMADSALQVALLTTVGTIFIAELTDKDALFLLAMATKVRPVVVFAAGSIAFAATTAIIVTMGSVLIAFVPVSYIRVAGGAIMLAYAVWEYRNFALEKSDVEARESSLIGRRGSSWSILLPAVATLIALDLAGDATEVLTVVLLARFEDPPLVFTGCVMGLIGAVAVETALGNRLARVLPPRRIKFFSMAVFVTIGAVVISTTILGI